MVTGCGSELLGPTRFAGVDGRAALSGSPQPAFQPEIVDITLKRRETGGPTEAGLVTGRRLRHQPVELHLAPKRHGTDLQRIGGLAPITAETLERAGDQGALLRLKVEAVVGRMHPRFL